jgi:lactate dehydrogenase-like 2-hydroxyacid dehydrogenase
MTAPIKIVRLDGIHLPSPTFSPSFAHSYTEYQLTPPNETATRLKDANVAITTTVHITSAILESCPNLKLVAVMAIGTDIVDVAACKERGVLVCNVPAASIESVAEHAISLYFAARRRTVRLHELVAGGTEWKARGSLNGVFGEGFPPTTGDEIMGVLGVGELGMLEFPRSSNLLDSFVHLSSGLVKVEAKGRLGHVKLVSKLKQKLTLT